MISHSYGSLVFDEMQRIAEERGWTCFQDVDVVMLAPSGSFEKENYLKLGWRLWVMLKTRLSAISR